MKSRFGLTAAGVVTLLVTSLPAGEINKFNGARIAPVALLSLDADEVRYKIRGIAPIQRLPAYEVESVVYTPERILENVERCVGRGQWDAALRTLGHARRLPVMEEALAFWQARIAYEQCLVGGGGWENAIEALEAFVSSRRTPRGFYLPEALGLLGNAYLSAGNVRMARARFAAIEALRGAARQLLGRLGQARADLVEKNARQAAEALKAVMDEARASRFSNIYDAAVVPYTHALVAARRAGEASEFLRNYMEARAEKNRSRDRASAQVNNALGDAYAAAGSKTDREQALFTYLRTTCFHRQWPAECAEALYKAEAIARTLGLEKDADGMARRLAAEYDRTRWAAKAASEAGGTVRTHGS